MKTSMVMSASSVFGLLSLVLLLVTCEQTTAGRVPRVPANLHSMFRSYFQCPLCNQNDCPPLIRPASEGCHPTKEPGICGCCMVCARMENEPCGILTPRCAEGLTCAPAPNNVDGQSEFHSLMKSEGLCMRPDAPYAGDFVPGFSKAKQRRTWYHLGQFTL